MKQARYLTAGAFTTTPLALVVAVVAYEPLRWGETWIVFAMSTVLLLAYVPPVLMAAAASSFQTVPLLLKGLGLAFLSAVVLVALVWADARDEVAEADALLEAEQSA